MKTEIGNTTKMFGREYNLSVTNYGGDEILKSYDILNPNTLLISSKVDNNLTDVGSYSIFMTDNKGYPVRLTYTIKPGNGLYVDPDDTDVLKMIIDEDSITADDGPEIYVNKSNIIDNVTLTVDAKEGVYSKRGKIAVVTDNLNKATNVSYGITKGDNYTTYIASEYPGQIRVNTQNLETVDDKDNRDGIVRHSSEMWRTIMAKDGKLEVLTYNLDKASGQDWGVVKTDDMTIRADDDGKISVLTSGLDKATPFNYGVVKGDENSVSVNDGIITVNTRNLSPATDQDLGVVKADKYSLTVDASGLLEVNRFNEIEAILQTNNPEHAIFRADIEDLKNRVAKLETTAQQELIEFLIPANDPETTLPMPIFDKTSGTVNHYSERKTISFSIKANCKFNVNVEYKENTNNYNQVTLLSVVYGDNAVSIPANQLSNTIFDETGQTVSTLSFTFAVKNYDKDDNYASINTQVIISAACINDAAIKQTSFHIFKCWNNLAFMEEKQIIDKPIEKPIETAAYWLYDDSSLFVELYGNSSKVVESKNNALTSGNFFFKTYIQGTYTYFNGTTWSQTPSIIQTYAPTTKITVKPYVDADLTREADWLTTTISATYNTTKQYDVISVNVKKPSKEQSSRIAYIGLFVNGEANGNEVLGNSLNQLISNNPVKLKEVDLRGKVSDISQITTQHRAINTIKDEIGRSGSAFSKSFKTIKNAKINTTFISEAQSEPLFKNLIAEDIRQYEKGYNVIQKFTDVPLNTDEEYKTFWNGINLMNTYADKISKEIVTAKEILINTDITRDTDNTHVIYKNNNKYKASLIYQYEEKVNVVEPVIQVVSNIATTGIDGIQFNMTRNPESVVVDTNWSLNIKYNFINKNGELVDANGNNQKVVDYEFTMYPKLNVSYQDTFKKDYIMTAASGFNVSTQSQQTYYNVVTISAGRRDDTSWLGWNSNNKDDGIAYFGGYNPSTNSYISKVTDDVYMVFKLTGQKAKISSSQKYSFYSFSIKNKDNGYKEALEFADEIDFVGISKNKYTKARSANYSTTLSIGQTKYIVKSASGYSSSNYCSYTASDEATSLKNISKTYYNKNSSKLVYDTKYIPISVANNITGIKIKEVKASTGAFGMEPKITFSSTGSWTHTTSSGNSGSSSTSNTEANKEYTFGNAKISSVTIDAWDDYEMRITFLISGGSTTNIPVGTNILELPSSSNGRTNFVFVNGGNTMMYNKYYDNYSFSSTKWTASKTCTVTYRLYNNYSHSNVGQYSTKRTLYNKETGMVDSVYSDNMYDTGNYTQSYSNTPGLTSITGLKFWIGLRAGSIILKLNFESSLSQNGSEIPISARYTNTSIQAASIVNALANSRAIVYR